MKNEHDELLTEWASLPQHQGKKFIRDGAIDIARWSEASRKVLFLLKEAYDDDDDNRVGYDLCEMIREDWKGPKYNIWNCIADWCSGIAKACDGQYPSLAEVEADRDARTNAFLACAVVNIKKSDGRSSSDMDEIRSIAAKERPLLKRQIKILGPDIIVCGYTWEATNGLWNSAKLPHTDLVYELPELRALAVDYWHPANQYPRHLNYHALLSVLNQAGAFGQQTR